MKLTKKDFVMDCRERLEIRVDGYDEQEQLKQQILKNQEDAEKWDELPDEFCRVDLDDMLEYAEDRQIKLRLKKRIEEYKEFTPACDAYIIVIDELQKILGEKK